MDRTQIFPIVMMILSLCAAVMWGLDGDWRKCVYWIAAFVLTFTITF